MMRLALCFLLLLLCLLPTGIARAGERILAVGEWPPYTSEHLEGGGETTRIVQAAFAASGVPTRVIFAPWNRCLELVLNGEATATFPFKDSPERAEDFLFSEPVDNGDSYLFCRDSDARVGRCKAGADLSGSRVGIVSSSYYVNELRPRVGQLVTTETGQQLMAMLQLGRLDYAVLNNRVARTALRRLPSGASVRIVRSEQPMYRIAYRLLLAKSNPDAKDLIQKFNAGLKTIQADGTLDRILGTSAN